MHSLLIAMKSVPSEQNGSVKTPASPVSTQRSV